MHTSNNFDKKGGHNLDVNSINFGTFNTNPNRKILQTDVDKLQENNKFNRVGNTKKYTFGGGFGDLK